MRAGVSEGEQMKARTTDLCEDGDGGVRVTEVDADDGWSGEVGRQLCVPVCNWAIWRHVGVAFFLSLESRIGLGVLLR